MPTVLTVDDSRAVRTIVSKQVRDLGFDVTEAEDGIQGLAKLGECQFDLVILDVTMPNMDGPTMLGKMREAGNETPVIMLTSESKRSIIAGAMKSGITDYILKPFKPEELRAKMLAVLDSDSPAGEAAAVAAVVDPAPAAASGAANRQFVDVLLVDDMENVARKLRSSLPQHMTLHPFTSAQAALAACREKMYRVIMIDSDLPDVQSGVLAKQMRLIQPHAAILALPLRSTNDVTKEMRDEGFDGVLFKPFGVDDIEDFLLKYFDNQEILVCEDNLLKAGPFGGKEERLAHYFDKLHELFGEAIKKVASACYDDVVLDLTRAPARQEKLPKALLQFAEEARQSGIELKLVGGPDVKRILQAFTETKALPVYASLQEARSGTAA
jgi:DNA-binding response OmpR family regulator/anti-anti-sigma regulatory factor